MTWGSISCLLSLEAGLLVGLVLGLFCPWSSSCPPLILEGNAERKKQLWGTKWDMGELVVKGLDGDPRLASLVFTGFGDRLLSEVKKLAPKDVKIKVRWWSAHGAWGPWQP